MIAHVRSDLAALIDGLPSKSAKIRALNAAGLPRADIARFLGVRYQHVRNVLVADEKRAQARAQRPEPVCVKLDEAGRLVVPAAFRDWIGVKPGERLVLEAEEGGVRLTPQSAALDRSRVLLKGYLPDGVSLSGEIIADRRSDAAQD